MGKFKLEKPGIARKQAAIDYINEFKKFNSDMNGVGGLDRYLDNYEGFLEKLEEDRTRVPDNERVPAETFFLIRISDSKIIGMINIRFVLNEHLLKFGQNIAYCIRPTERRKGYNKINLYLGLIVAKEHGLHEV